MSSAVETVPLWYSRVGVYPCYKYDFNACGLLAFLKECYRVTHWKVGIY
jgi:hypothetical protein